VTCYTCHRVSSRPDFIPSLAEQYTVAPPKEPYDVTEAPPGTPTAQQTLDKYLKALGNADALAKLTSISAKGMYAAYETEMMDVPVEIFAKAPAQRTMIVHTLFGDTIVTYDGQSAWTAGPEALKVLPVLQLTGGELESARLDAQLSFPGQIKKLLTEWRVGEPTTIDDSDVQVLQGTADNKSPVTLYFDDKSGLLVRQVRYIDSKVGIDPLQIDYSDYRDVAGIKIPFHVVVTWVDNQSTTQLTEIKANVPIDAAKFAKPNPPTPKQAAR
jgi:zinc protease